MKNRIRLFFRLLKKENEILKGIKEQIQYLKEQDGDKAVLMCQQGKIYSYTQSGGHLVAHSEKKPELLTGFEYKNVLNLCVNKGSIEVLTIPAAIAKLQTHYKEVKDLF